MIAAGLSCAALASGNVALARMPATLTPPALTASAQTIGTTAKGQSAATAATPGAVTSAVPGRLTIALTADRVDVDAGFSGAQLTLFGVIDGDDRSTGDEPIHIAAIIEGPKRNVISRQIVRTGPIWTPTGAMIIKDVPGLYYVLTSAPPGQLTDSIAAMLPALSLDQLHFHKAPDTGPTDGTNAPIPDPSTTPPTDPIPKPAIIEPRVPVHDPATGHALGDSITRALVRDRQSRGLFREADGAITRLDNGLFAVPVSLPAQTPVGDYQVLVIAWRGGVPIAQDRASLSVRKAGIERQIYEFARNHAFAYGVMCVLISLIAGWTVSLVFRRK